MASPDKLHTYMSLVEEFDNFPTSASPEEAYYQLFLPSDDQPHGYMLPETVSKMPWTSAFRVRHENPRSVTVVDHSGGKNTSEAVSQAFADLVNLCIDQNLFQIIDGKHSEPFSIIGANYPVCLERFSSSLFGIITRGSHLMAYTRKNGKLHVWISRRAAHLFMHPNMLDVTVAGGIKAGVSPFETIVQEADEEASLPESLVRSSAQSRGALTHMSVSGPSFPAEQGLVIPDLIYVYDMEVADDIIPRPHDDEVKDFRLMSVDEIREAMFRGEFKPDAAGVLIDFFIRHSVITAENEKNFAEIQMHLHRLFPFRTAPNAESATASYL